MQYSSKWYSHKFSFPGLQHEVAWFITKANIVWVNGAFPCGSYLALWIFRKALKRKVFLEEFIVADGGYSDEKCLLVQNISVNIRSIFQDIRAQHESVSKRLKQF